MNHNNFQQILNESQKEFDILFQENKVKSTIKKVGSSISKTINNTKSSVKNGLSSAKNKSTEAAKNKAKEVITNKAKEVTTPKEKESSEKPKKKSGLDDLNTVSKSSTGKQKVKEAANKVKEAANKVGKTVKQTAKDPIKAGTIVGAVAGGAAGAATGFGVGNMVKDIADGAKQVKNKLLESLNFETNLTEKLQVVLSDLHLLVQTTHNFHWNIVSTSFYEYHKLFDEHYENLNNLIDDWAEYLRQLDIKPNGNYSDYLVLSNLKEPENGENYSDFQMFEKLNNDYEILFSYLKTNFLNNDEIDDEILKDKITNIYQICSKQNWIIKSTLKNMNVYLYESATQFDYFLNNINENNFLEILNESQKGFNNFLREIKNQ